MSNQLNDPRYVYADILIALAYADDDATDDERRLLDSMFDRMQLDPETIQKMWLTPRTMDVVSSMLKNIANSTFKRSLLKDCYLLAYADDEVAPEESKFIKNMASAMDLDADITTRVHEWVRTSLRQKQEAEALFGCAL